MPLNKKQTKPIDSYDYNQTFTNDPTKQQCYRQLAPILLTIQVRLTRYAGYYCWIEDELISNVLSWTPTHGHTSVDQPIYIYQLCADTGCSLEDLSSTVDY